MEAPLKVFVSSVIGEFLAERKAMKKALERSPFANFWVFERETASAEALVPGYLRRVTEADIVVLLIGEHITDPVKEEFQTALSAERPILAFVKSSAVKQATELFVAYNATFRFKYAVFDGPDLAAKVIEAVGDEILLRFRLSDRATHTLVDRLPRLPAGELEQLQGAYRQEILRKYEYWFTHYTPLRAIAAVQGELPSSQVKSTPTAFRPRGFQLLFRRLETRREHYPDLREAVEQHGDLIVLGEPGAGKTTTLWRLMFDYAQKGRTEPGCPLPVLISLGRYRPGMEILDLVRSELELGSKDESGKVEYPAHGRVAAHLDQFLANGRLLLLFDAVNEMPLASYTESIGRLKSFRDAQRGQRYVFTCRSLDYVVKFDIPEAAIEELDQEAQRDFLTAYLGSAGSADLYKMLREEHRDLLALGRNPYMLRMVGVVFQEQGILPANQGLLFRRFVETLVEREHEARPARWLASKQKGQLLSGISDLALAVQKDYGGGTSFSSRWAAEILSKAAVRRGHEVESDPDEVIYLARGASILDQASDGSLRFTHQLLQEYFASAALAELGASSALLHDAVRYPKWDEVLALLAGLMDDSTPLVEMLIPLDLHLAARCVAGAQKVLPAVCEKLIGHLMALLESRFETERRRAVESLRSAASEETLTLLLRWIGPENPPRARQAAAYALGGVPNAGSRLASLLKDPDKGVRISALRALGDLKVGDTAPQIVRCLKQEILREWAVQALWSFAAEAVIPSLLPLVNTRKDSKIRLAALRVLQEHKTAAAVQTVLPLLEDPNPQIRAAAAKAAGMLGASEAIPGLALLLSDGSVRVAAAKALGNLGAEQAIPQLIELLHEKDDDARRAAADALTRLRPEAVTPHFLGWLGSTNPRFRAAACQLLGRLQADQYIRYLVPLLEDGDQMVKRAAIEAVSSASSPPLDRLISFLEDENPQIRFTVAEVVGRTKPEIAASGLVPLLKEAVSPDWSWRFKAVEALGKLKVDAPFQQLVPLLNDADGWVRMMAAEILGAARATAAIPSLLTLLEKQDDTMGRRGATFALGMLGVKAAAPHLIPLLREQQLGPRLSAAESLGALGPEFLPELLPLLKDPAYQIRQAVENLWSTGATEEHLALLRPLLCGDNPDVSNRAFNITRAAERRLNLPKDYSFI